jgi:hypothetical protein
MSVLAYVPLLEPIAFFHEWWYLLLLPLSFGISMIYKAMRMEQLDGFWRQVSVMTAQIILAMIGLSICLIVLVQVIIPLIPVQR